MQNNREQIKMPEVGQIMRSIKFTDLLNDLCTKYGQGTLADQIGMDPAGFSRFKNGDGNISLKNLEALLSFSDTVIIPASDLKRLMMSFFTVNDLWKKSMGW